MSQVIKNEKSHAPSEIIPVFCVIDTGSTGSREPGGLCPPTPNLCGCPSQHRGDQESRFLGSASPRPRAWPPSRDNMWPFGSPQLAEFPEPVDFPIDRTFWQCEVPRQRLKLADCFNRQAARRGSAGRGADRSPGGSKHPLSLRPDSSAAMQARVTCHGKCVTILLPRGWLLNRVV
jgi:hypothetical protein